jgi:hypothetical protein
MLIELPNIKLSKSAVSYFLILMYGLTDMAQFYNFVLRIRRTTTTVALLYLSLLQIFHPSVGLSPIYIPILEV